MFKIRTAIGVLIFRKYFYADCNIRKFVSKRKTMTG